MAQGGINSTTGPSASQPPARVPVWDRLTAASQSKSLPQPTPHHADSQPRVLKAVQAKTVCLGFNFGPSPLIVAPDGNNESSSSSLYGIYDTGQWASTGGMSGREISPSRQARLQGQSGRFGSPGSVAASLSRRKVNSNPSMTSIQPGGGSSRPPHPSQPTPQLSSQQGPAVAAMASLFQASMGMLQAASGASDGETSKKRTSREGQLTTPRGGAGDRDTMTLGGGPGGGSGTLPTLPMHQLQMNDPGESMSKPFAGATSSMGGSFSSTHQRATNASTSNPAATAAALPVGSQSVKLTAALYGPSRIGNSPSRRS